MRRRRSSGPAALAILAAACGDAGGGAADPPRPAIVLAPASGGPTICIDPGHVPRADHRTEPSVPGPTDRRSLRGTIGTTGAVTGRPEFVVTLDIAGLLTRKLLPLGYTVALTRIDNSTMITNRERPLACASVEADLQVSIHADGNEDPTAHGAATLVPARTRYTGAIYETSRRAGERVHRAMVEATGARDRGVQERDDLVMFNWASVPAVLVEVGFLTNPEEDARLADPGYVGALTAGIARGIDSYLGSLEAAAR